MNVRIRLFARARDLVGADTVSLELPSGATVADLRRRLAVEQPALGQLLDRSALAVDHAFAGNEVVLPPQAEIALVPPVSGGGCP
jgi:molybdopterin converting factor subunit 1